MDDTDKLRIVRLVRGFSSDLTRAAVEALQAEVPAYRTLDRAQVAELRQVIGWVVGRTFEVWAFERPLDDHEVARFRRLGAARARTGRPLDGVLRAYRVAASSAMAQLALMAENEVSVRDVVDLTRVWFTVQDRLGEAVTAGYRSVQDRTPDDRRHALRELLDDLIAGRDPSRLTVTARFENLGLAPPDSPHVLVAALPDGTTEAPPPLLAAAGGSGLATARHGRVVVLLGGSEHAAAIATMLPAGSRAAVVAADGLEHVDDAWRLADGTVENAPEHAYARRTVLDDGDAHVLALVTGRPATTPAALAARVLGPLVAPRQAHLLAGLSAVLEHGSATAAAEHHGLHAQTVRYRLRRVEQLTGRSLADGWDRFCFGLAVQAHRATGGGTATARWNAPGRRTRAASAGRAAGAAGRRAGAG